MNGPFGGSLLAFSFPLVVFQINYFIDLPANSRRSPAESVASDLSPSCSFLRVALLYFSYFSLTGSSVSHRSRIATCDRFALFASPKVSPNSISASIRGTRVVLSQRTREIEEVGSYRAYS